MTGDTFSLAWRADEPVLDYSLRGFWTVEDAQKWVDAMTTVVAGRPAGEWFMFGDLREMRAQTAAVNELRNQVTRLTLANGLSGCVMVLASQSSQMQLQRLLQASARPDIFRYVDSFEEGENALAELMATT